MEDWLTFLFFNHLKILNYLYTNWKKYWYFKFCVVKIWIIAVFFFILSCFPKKYQKVILKFRIHKDKSFIKNILELWLLVTNPIQVSHFLLRPWLREFNNSCWKMFIQCHNSGIRCNQIEVSNYDLAHGCHLLLIENSRCYLFYLMFVLIFSFNVLNGVFGFYGIGKSTPNLKQIHPSKN